MGKYSALNITGVLAGLLWSQGAAGADLIFSPEPLEGQNFDLTLPAVSGPNGKLELYGGLVNPGSAAFRAAGSFTLPLTDRFGIQLDASLQGSGAGLLAGGAVHAFTRDPDSYLIGLAAGAVRGPSGLLGVVGVEGEAYLDRVSIEAWAGVGGLNYDDPALADLTGVFVFADAAYYVTDDFRVSAGFSHLLGENGLHLASEYQLRDYNLPFSLAGDVRVTSTGYSIMGGIKGYIGGDPNKSLIDRHRQDDPPNRALSLFMAAGSMLYAVAPNAPFVPPDNELACNALEPEYYWDFSEEQCLPSPYPQT